MKIIQSLLASMAMLAYADNAMAGNIVISSPEDYQVLSLSHNGQWACGEYIDYSNKSYAFLWNLASGHIQLLGTATESECWAVSDNGIVSGTFTTTEASGNGSESKVPGYYKDGAWHMVQLPQGYTGAGMGLAISPDGHYMTGVLKGANYIPYIWKDGQIYRQLETKNTGMPYAISPDGQSAAGWRYRENRTPCIWNADGTISHISDYESPWSYVRDFTGDGKNVVFWGGWEDNMEHSTLRAIYNLETKETTLVPTINNGDELEFFDITDDCMVVGSTGEPMSVNRAVLYRGNGLEYVDDYLESLGVDFSQHNVATTDDGIKMIFRAQSISGDGKVWALLYYTADYALKTMIVKLDQNADALPPADVAVSQVEGLPSACLTWKAPLGASAIQGYNIYRNDVKVTDAPVNKYKYYDTASDFGTYSYKVAAVYDNGNEIASEPLSITMKPKEISTPRMLNSRQKGYNSARLTWRSPFSNLYTNSYTKGMEDNIQGFGAQATISAFEVAVKFDADEMACIPNGEVRQVAFYPMEQQNGVTINLYSRDAQGALQLLKSIPVTQQLNYRERNIVTLTPAVAVPNGELIVSVKTAIKTASNNMVGVVYGSYTPGYSDLLRAEGEEDFYSFYEASSASGYPYFASWPIDVIVAPADLKDENIDVIDHYSITDNGVEAATVTDTYADLPNLSEGAHQIGVSAVYANGTKSAEVTISQAIANAYQPVSNVKVAANGLTAADISWEAPVDDDLTLISYCSGNAVDGPVGPSENNYGLMAAAEYEGSRIKAYDGYKVKAIKFYPTADAFFTLILKENGQEVANIEVDDYVLNQWNTIMLDTPVTVDATSKYSLIVDCFDVDPGLPALAIDDTAPFSYVSDLYSLDGERWSSIQDASLYGNWMIGWEVVSPEYSDMPITGYDVTIDGSKKNSALITDTYYSYDFGAEDAVRHSAVIGAHYALTDRIVESKAQLFYIGTAAGINGLSASNVVLQRNADMLMLTGDDVDSMQLYSAAGALKASVKGNTLSTAHLSSGIYMLKYSTGAKTKVLKVVVE